MKGNSFSGNCFTATSQSKLSMLCQLVAVALWLQLVACQSPSYRLPTDLIPRKYDLKILTDLDNFTFSGSVSIQVYCQKETSNITLHAKDLSLGTPTLKDSSNNNVSVTSVSAGDNDFLTLQVGSNLTAGSVYLLVIDFTANLTDGLQGYYRSRYTDSAGQSKWMSVTQLAFDYARQVFPCWDEPSFRANFTIYLAHRSNLTAISNMPLLARIPHESLEGFVWSEFIETPPIATEIVAFVIGEFESTTVYSGEIPFTFYTVPGKLNQTDVTMSVAPTLLSYYNSYFAKEYPLPKLDYIAIPDFYWFGMENWGCITAGELEALFNSSMTTSQKYDVYSNIAHEMFHQWVGDLVDIDWWDGMWLKEGFAYYFEGVALAYIFPDWNTGVLEVISQTFSSFDSDASSTGALAIQSVIDDPNGNPGTYNYAATEKACLIVYMIQKFLGDEVFQQGLQIYISRYQYQSVNKTSLYTSFDEASRDKHLLPEGLDIGTVLDTWVLQAGLPLLNCTRNGTTITVTQQRFINLELNQTAVGSEKWYVPITFSTASNVNNDTTTNIWLHPAQSELVVETGAECTDWLIVNVKSGVYCVVNYDPLSWCLIIDHLHNGDLSLIDEFNRHSLVTNVFHLANVGYVPYSLAFQLIRYGVRERSYIAWRGINIAIIDIEPLLKRTDVFPYFKAMVQDLLGDVYQTLGYFTDIPAHYQGIRLKILVVALAVEYDLGVCVSQALEVFQQWKTQQIGYTEISPDMFMYATIAGIKNGGQAEWDFVYQQLDQPLTVLQQQNLLYALAWSQNETVLQRYLNLSLDSTSKIPASSAAVVFGEIASASVIGYNTAFAFLESNALQIDTYTSNLGSYIYSIYSASVFEADMQRMQTFLSNNAALLSTYQSDIDSAKSSAQWNLLWMSKHYQDIYTSFTTAFNNSCTC